MGRLVWWEATWCFHLRQRLGMAGEASEASCLPEVVIEKSPDLPKIWENYAFSIKHTERIILQRKSLVKQSKRNLPEELKYFSNSGCRLVRWHLLPPHGNILCLCPQNIYFQLLLDGLFPTERRWISLETFLVNWRSSLIVQKNHSEQRICKYSVYKAAESFAVRMTVK